MDGEKLIQVSLQIPSSALDSLSRLAEQLRLLAEAAGPQAASAVRTAEAEHMESASFDSARFQALRQIAGAQPAVPPASPALKDAEAVSAAVRETVPEAERAGTHPENPSEESVRTAAEEPLRQNSFSPFTGAEGTGGIPTARPGAAGQLPDAPEARREAERQIPDMESARAEAKSQELLLSAVQGEVSGGIETPLGAGVVVQTQPESAQSRWSGVTEELVTPGPAPLTAEAVSLAFERDGRRYDNGFPLY